MLFLHDIMEGTVSQICFLGLSFYEIYKIKFYKMTKRYPAGPDKLGVSRRPGQQDKRSGQPNTKA